MSAIGEPIELPGPARALFTAQEQGNLSSVGGPHSERALSARETLRRRCGAQVLVRGYQVHGSAVARVHRDGTRVPAAGEEADVRALSDSPQQPSLRVDGHAVAVPGVAALVMAADCLPVVLAAPGAVAALHAGWRGLAAGVLEQGVLALRELGADGPIVAIVGPGAGPCCYEVGPEVHAAFAAPVPSQSTTGPQPSRARPGPIDLRAIAHRRLHAAGVAEVADVAACTICDERFFSFRREGTAAGRQAGIAWLL